MNFSNERFVKSETKLHVHDPFTCSYTPIYVNMCTNIYICRYMQKHKYTHTYTQTCPRIPVNSIE